LGGQVTKAENLIDDANVLAKELAGKPPLAIAATKALINTSFDKSILLGFKFNKTCWALYQAGIKCQKR